MDQQQPWGTPQQGPYPPQPPSGPNPSQPASGALPQQPPTGYPQPPAGGATPYGPYPPHPGAAAQPPSTGTGAIAVTLKYHWMAFVMGLFKPQMEINGHVAARGWGRQVVPLPPGRYNLHVHVPYLLPPRIGNADLPVVVHPGQTVELEYLAPLIVFIGGALGVPPQKYPGMTAQIILLVFVLVMFLCAGGFFLLALFAASGTTSP